MIGTQTTWGLTGPTFLWMYGALCVAVAAAIAWQWRQALGSKPGVESAQLDAYRLAMLNGGPQLAITAAATTLHTAGVLRDGDRPRTLVVDGRLDRDADELERAVFDVVWREPEIKTSALRRELERSEPVAGLASRLADVGLLMKPEVIARLRRLWVPGVALVVLGAARVWAGLDAGAPVAYLAIMVVAVACATVWLAFQRPWASARGRALLARRRTGRMDLISGGAGAELPLAVALFGGGALWAADPGIASAWGVPRESAWDPRRGGCGGTGGGCAAGMDGGGGGGGGCGGGCGGAS